MTPTATSTGAVLLDIQGVRRRHGGTHRVLALDGVDLTLQRGEVVALQGPSGSGKTTLCNIIAGWEDADAGHVTWRVDIGHPPSWRELAVVPQRLGLLPDLSLRDNVRLPVWVAGIDADVGNWLHRLGLTAVADRRPDDASLGEQQRAALARALAVRPHLAVLDEPTSSQDEAHVARVTTAISEAAADGTTVLVATHDERVANRADRVVRLRDGRVDAVPPWR